jgi:hypothetical protein
LDAAASQEARVRLVVMFFLAGACTKKQLRYALGVTAVVADPHGPHSWWRSKPSLSLTDRRSKD